MKYKIILYLALIHFSFFQTAYSQPTTTEQIFSEKFQAIITMEDYYEKMKDEEKAEFGFVLLKEIYNNNIINSYPQYIKGDAVNYIDFSINYFKQTKQKERYMEACILKGQFFERKRDYANASRIFLEVLDTALTEQNNHFLGIIHFHLSRLAGYQDEFEKALEYADESINYFTKDGDSNSIGRMHLIKSWIYQAAMDFQSANESSFEALKHTKDSIIIGDLISTIGINFSHLGQIDSALHYIHQSLEYPALPGNMSVRYYHIADIYHIMKEYDTTIQYIEEAFKYPIDIYFERDCYNILKSIAQERNEHEKVIEYAKMYRACQDSILKLTNQPNINAIEKIHQLNKQTIKIKTHRWYLFITILILLSLSTLLVVYLWKKHQRKKVEAESYKIVLEEKEELIDIQQEEIEKRHALLILDLADKLKRTKEKYAIKRAKGNFEERCEIDKTIYKEVFHFDKEKTFIIKMNHILNGLPDKLKADYPEITYKEIVYCCLLIVDLPTNEIALILDYKQTSLYKFKQRLIKKLDLPTAKELEQMLHDKMKI